MRPVVRISLVVAMSENGVIGRAGGLPWRLSSDMKLFKAITMGKPIVMGSNTWDSLPKKPLPGRLNLVLSRDLKFEAEGAIVCATLFEAFDIAREHAIDDGVDEICVIGGGNLYAQTLARADRLYVTLVHAEVEGDTHFPAIDPAQWHIVGEDAHPRAEGDDHAFAFRTYERLKP